MFKELKRDEKQLLQSIEDVMNDYVIPFEFKGEKIREIFDQFYKSLKK